MKIQSAVGITVGALYYSKVGFFIFEYASQIFIRKFAKRQTRRKSKILSAIFLMIFQTLDIFFKMC